MPIMTGTSPAWLASPSDVSEAKQRLDAHTVETVQWHFHESTGSPFWLGKKSELKFDPLKEIKCFDDLKKFPMFEDEWLRGGPVERWIPKGLAGKPTYVFETGGTTGIPKSRVVIDDFRIDYELFSHTLPDEYFPKGANWLMLGPSGPRRLRLAVEHLCQYRGGICFCIDLDPRWVIKLIKKGWMEHLEEYKKHCIDQAITILTANHNIKCMFATPKLLESLAMGLAEKGTTLRECGITGIFSGGTEFTPQWTRFCVEELLEGLPDLVEVDGRKLGQGAVEVAIAEKQSGQGQVVDLVVVGRLGSRTGQEKEQEKGLHRSTNGMRWRAQAFTAAP
jgi:hypothetical protein